MSVLCTYMNVRLICCIQSFIFTWLKLENKEEYCHVFLMRPHAKPLLVAVVCFPKLMFQILRKDVEYKDVCLYQQHQ